MLELPVRDPCDLCEGMAGREERSVSYRIPALPRGRYRSGPLRARLTDPFHFVDVMRSYTATADFLVGPVVERLPGSDPPQTKADSVRALLLTGGHDHEASFYSLFDGCKGLDRLPVSSSATSAPPLAKPMAPPEPSPEIV